MSCLVALVSMAAAAGEPMGPGTSVAASPDAIRWAQVAPGRGPRMREAGDHDIAIGRRSEIVDLNTVIRTAEQAGNGRYVGMEPRGTNYLIKVIQPGGRVVWVDVNGRTGTVMRVRD
jgi:hypothetical protein